MRLNRQQTALAAAAGVSLLAWFVPVLTLALQPITYLNTHIHEMCHAIAASLTGGEAERILVHANGAGETPVRGGLILIVASAGYVGAAAIGAVLIAWGKDEKRARTLLGALGCLLLFSLAVWVRGDAAGVLWGGFWVLALGACALFLRGQVAVFTVQFVGLQQCLNALSSIFTLLQISLVTEAQSDATNMQSATGIPAMFWAVLWAVIAAAFVVLALRRAWR
jgi:hypothetical protein